MLSILLVSCTTNINRMPETQEEDELDDIDVVLTTPRANSSQGMKLPETLVETLPPPDLKNMPLEDNKEALPNLDMTSTRELSSKEGNQQNIPFFKIAYMTVQNLSTDPKYRLWLLSNDYRDPQLLLDFSSQNTPLSSYFVWSHSGNYLAYAHMMSGGEISVSILELESLEQKETDWAVLVDDPFGSVSYGTPSVFPGSWSLDDKWLAVFLRNTSKDSQEVVLKTLIINVDSRKIIQLDENIEFRGWSPIKDDEYLYIFHPLFPKSGEATVHIGSTNEQEPIATIDSLENYALSSSHLIWAPDGKQAILEASTKDNLFITVNLLLDLETETWKQLELPVEDIFSWSPNAQWVVSMDNSSLLFKNMLNPQLGLVSVKPQTSSFIPKTWIPNSDTLVVQGNNIIYLVDPNVSDELSKLSNLNNFKIRSEWPINANIWLASIDNK